MELHASSKELAFLNADPDSVTVSGYSTGGSFANHLLIVMSDTVKGAGICKGGAFHSSHSDWREPEEKPAEFFRD
jgi:poly(3-hydroxybutyrate) depolymerase